MASTPPFRPPAGWVELISAVEGITVFGPPPEGVAETGPIVARCDQCGGALAFDPARQASVCTACGTLAERAEAVGGLAAADANAFTLEALDRCARGWGVERKTLHCESCGADLAVETAALSATCPFCASNKVALQAGDPAAVRPGWVLPFRLEAGKLSAGVREWLGRGWMHPGELVRLAQVDRFVGSYLPVWVFDARTDVPYRCEVGTEHQVSTRRNGRTETKTVVRWAWKEGRVDRRWTDVRVSATTRVSAVLWGRILPGFDMGGLVTYQSGLLAGFGALAYDVALPEAWETGRAEIRELVRQACERHAKGSSGDHVRNLSVSARMSEESWRYVLAPAYVSTYRYGERRFQVLVNGQTGEVHGQKPVIWWRVYAVIALMLSPAVCAGVVGVPLTLAGGAGLVVLVFALVFLILGGVGGAHLWKHALAAEAA